MDRQFAKICGVVPKPPHRERVCQAWILMETWHLVYKRISVRWGRQEEGEQISVQCLSYQTRTSLQGDRRHRATEAGGAIESLFESDPTLVKET